MLKKINIFPIIIQVIKSMANEKRLESLEGLKNLEYLTLEYIKICSSPFRRLSALRKLLLIGCDLQEASSDLFKYLTNLRVLELRSIPLNNYRTIKFSIKSLAKLEWIEFSGENDEFMSFKHLSKNLKVLRISNSSKNSVEMMKKFQDFKHSNLVFLDLALINSDEFDAKCLSGLTNLSNLCLNLSRITRIYLENEFLNKLRSLSFYGCGGVEFLDSPLKKLSNLEILEFNLQTKNYSTLTSQTFKGLDKLQQLFLSNQLRSVFDRNLFREMKNLTVLDLRGNMITCLTRLFSLRFHF